MPTYVNARAIRGLVVYSAMSLLWQEEKGWEDATADAAAAVAAAA
jgi:hypothetical protein